MVNQCQKTPLLQTDGERGFVLVVPENMNGSRSRFTGRNKSIISKERPANHVPHLYAVTVQ